MTATNHSPIRVLIVDDAPNVRRDLCTALTLAGNIEVVGEAANGLAALHLVESLQPAVVLMDMEMPVMDGYEATRRIKECCPTCRVTALTVHSYESARQRATEAGVDDFVVKGAPLESLVKAISQARE